MIESKVFFKSMNVKRAATEPFVPEAILVVLKAEVDDTHLAKGRVHKVVDAKLSRFLLSDRKNKRPMGLYAQLTWVYAQHFSLTLGR